MWFENGDDISKLMRFWKLSSCERAVGKEEDVAAKALRCVSEVPVGDRVVAGGAVRQTPQRCIEFAAGEGGVVVGLGVACRAEVLSVAFDMLLDFSLEDVVEGRGAVVAGDTLVV